ncbi:uncharacterized protein RSE6_12272 [Rhynchosporium secalis]|uniref:Uncharacterized protein n=1 Tax=Rhynchosporium secalis TaxID=38038 RepID=A0A1E1MQ12_RHYSE|nr:uncharacterized protein RSE6_12272 [Rhynchosporium secalis]
MSAPNNTITTDSSKRAEDLDVKAMMAGNHEDLGRNGLAGSRWAIPGVTYGFKKEFLVRMAAVAAEKKRLEAEEVAKKANGSGNGTSTDTATSDAGGMDVDTTSSNA